MRILHMLLLCYYNNYELHYFIIIIIFLYRIIYQTWRHLKTIGLANSRPVGLVLLELIISGLACNLPWKTLAEFSR